MFRRPFIFCFAVGLVGSTSCRYDYEPPEQEPCWQAHGRFCLTPIQIKGSRGEFCSATLCADRCFELERTPYSCSIVEGEATCDLLLWPTVTVAFELLDVNVKEWYVDVFRCDGSFEGTYIDKYARREIPGACPERYVEFEVSVE